MTGVDDWVRFALQILGWICDDGCEEPLRFACGEALAALASDSGPDGLGVACAWLGDLLIHLTKGVKTYQSIREVLDAKPMLIDMLHLTMPVAHC